MASNYAENAWQFNKNVCNRNKHMLENELETDVVFKVSSFQENPRTIRAHKYMLISASPVFWAMFCGELKEDCHVIVPDVEPEAFIQMLRYIYTDEMELTGNQVMHVLNVAKKYQLPSLVEICINYLDNQLKASNACLVLEHSRFFNEETLSMKCMKAIEEKTEVAISSEDFMAISKETLSFILDSDKLRIEELKLFERSYEWARHKVNDVESIREALGECLFKIRFPIIPMKQFAEVVSSKDVLNKDEKLEMFMYIATQSDSKKPQAFNCNPRKPAVPRILPGQHVRVKQNKRYVCKDGLFSINVLLTPTNQLIVSSITDGFVTVSQGMSQIKIPMEDIVF